MDEELKRAAEGLLEVRYYNKQGDWDAVVADLDILITDIEGMIGEEVSREELLELIEEMKPRLSPPPSA